MANNPYEEKDNFIKNIFKEDAISDQAIFSKFATHLNNSKIKPTSLSNSAQAGIIVFLLLLIMAIGFFLANSYYGFIDFSPKPSTPTINTIKHPTNTSVEEPKEKENENNNNIVNETTNTNIVNEISNTIENTSSNTLTNEVSNTVDNTDYTNTVTNEISNTVTNETNTSQYHFVNVSTTTDPQDFSNLDAEEIKKFITEFSVGIERINFDSTSLENNTLLLFIAKSYFDKNASKPSLAISTDYASTIENMHKYLNEFTGKNYPITEPIKSYNNYVGFSKASNAYILGQNVSTLSKEKYTVENLNIENYFNGAYSATAYVIRNLNDESTKYKINFEFSINNNYQYQKYCLKSLKSSNVSCFPDNTIHLVDNSN